jgi:hypothetical protein
MTGKFDVRGYHSAIYAKERSMTTVEKVIVLFSTLALLVDGGMLQAQQPTFYWAKSSQCMGEFGYGLHVGAGNNNNQHDDSPSFPSNYSDSENVMYQEAYSASVPGASAYGEYDIYCYVSDDNQSTFETGIDVDGILGGSVSSPGTAGVGFGMWQLAEAFNEAILSSETGTETTCRLTMDISWVGTNNYPFDINYGAKCPNGYKFLYASASIGTYLSMSLYEDDDFNVWVEGWTPTESYVLIAGSTPITALCGSFEVGYSDLVGTVPVGEMASCEIDIMQNLDGMLPINGNYGPCETTSTNQTNITIWADQ